MIFAYSKIIINEKYKDMEKSNPAVTHISTSSNIKEYSVTEISSKVKLLIEGALGYVRVRGEISGFTLAGSGHGYFSIKDTNAVLSCTCWRHSISRLKIKPEDGMEVIVTGKVTTYAKQSRYQMTVESIEPAGVGALMQILEKRKEQFRKEGLFDEAHKKLIPLFPQRIAVVTSLSGAVIRDILHRIEERFPTHIMIWPVTVQGDSAADEVTNAIISLNNYSALKLPKPDLIIVARGGDSIEDLWPFNEEQVVKAVFHSSIPVISAIGHETDFTLIDFVSDKRAPTPTAAAEFATPVMSQLIAGLKETDYRMSNGLNKTLIYQENKLSIFATRLRDPMQFLRYFEQRLDELSYQLETSLPRALKMQQSKLERFNIDNLSPMRIISLKQQKLNHIKENLGRSIEKKWQTLTEQYNSKAEILASLDYKKVLKRGYAVIRDEDNNAITSAKLNISKNITVEMQDGMFKAKIEANND